MDTSGSLKICALLFTARPEGSTSVLQALLFSQSHFPGEQGSHRRAGFCTLTAFSWWATYIHPKALPNSESQREDKCRKEGERSRTPSLASCILPRASSWLHPTFYSGQEPSLVHICRLKMRPLAWASEGEQLAAAFIEKGKQLIRGWALLYNVICRNLHCRNTWISIQR